MECVDQETEILAPRTDPSRAVISIKADDRFAECACEMQRAGIGRDHEVAPVKNGDETTKTATQCLLGGMTTLLKHFLSQDGFPWGGGADKNGM
jgi:hypothetical protein